MPRTASPRSRLAARNGRFRPRRDQGRLRRVRAPGRAGAAIARTAGAARWRRPFTFADGDVDGVSLHGQPDGLHRRGWFRASCPPTTLWRCGTRVLEAAVVPCGLGARDTLRLEVCSTRCTETTSGPRRTRSRPGSVGSSALDNGFHRRERVAPGQGRRSRSAARRRSSWKSTAIPRQGMPIVRGRRGHVGLALADARARDRAGLRPGRAGAARARS